MKHRDEANASLDRFLNGLLVGAGLMYFGDPDRGRRRRALARDRGIHMAHQGRDATNVAARDLRNRGTGFFARSRARLRRGSADPQVIDARVRARLGRLVSHPSAIETSVENGTVTLHGPVLREERDELLRGVSRVRGVRGVRDELSVHDRPDFVPGLQGEGRDRAHRPELRQEYWSPSTRLVMGLLGGGLTTKGVRSGGILGTLMTLGGAGLLARSATNLRFARLTGVNLGPRAIDVQKTITVHAPIQEVFDFWSDFENLPRFMSHLKEVHVMSGGRSHWIATGPAGIHVSWDAEITGYERNELIAWKSIGSSPVENAGIVRFQPIDENSTRIDVRMSYNPVAGAIGHVVASFFGVDPKKAMDEDMVRFKSLLEEGKTSADGRLVTRGEAEARLGLHTAQD